MEYAKDVEEMHCGLEIYVNVMWDFIIYLAFVPNAQEILFGMETVVLDVDKILISLLEIVNANLVFIIFLVSVINVRLVQYLMEKIVYYPVNQEKFGLDLNVYRYVKGFQTVIGMEYNAYVKMDFII
jgi:hypothetical protein